MVNISLLKAMEISMTDNGRMGKKMGKVVCSTQTIKYMRETGKIIGDMVKARSIFSVD